MKCDAIDGSVVDGVRQPIFYSFVFDKPSGYKVFCEPETIHYKKNKSVLNTVTFYLEDDNKEEVDFNGEIITFTLQMIKILYIKGVLINLEMIHIVSEADINLLQQKFMVI